MRLTPDQTRIIKDTIHRVLDPNAQVWLFGSRIDENRRGGDVDLYVETDRPRLLAELQCKANLEEALDLHVDLVIRQPERDHPIYSIAKAEGIPL